MKLGLLLLKGHKAMNNSVKTMKNKLTGFVKLLNKNYKHDDKGVAAIEMALIFPVMALLFIGMIDLTDGLSASRKTTITANTLGDLITQTDGTVNKAQLNGIFEASEEIMKPYDTTKVGLEIYGFTPDAGGNPKLDWSYKKPGGPNCGGAPAAGAQMKLLMSQGNDVVVSRTCFNYKYILSNLAGGNYILGGLFTSSGITLKEEMILRPRKTLRLQCSNC